MQSLLRLPPYLRIRLLQESLPQTRCCLSKEYARFPHAQRSLSNAAKGGKDSKAKPLTTRPSPIRRPAPTLKKGVPPEKGNSNERPPPPPSPTPNVEAGRAGFNRRYLTEMFRSGKPVLLYVAPDHTSLYFFSYLLGGLLLVGTFNGIYIQLGPSPNQNSDTPRRLPWYVIAVSIVYGAMIGGFGILLMTTPVKMIRTITAKPLVSGSSSSLTLLCEVKPVYPFLPFNKPQTIEVRSELCSLDMSTSGKVDCTNVKMEGAEAFTAAPPKFLTPQTRGGLLHPWDVLTRDVRRMFLREGFARVHIEGHGNCKLDMQGCQLLDRGEPLSLVMSEGAARGFGPFAWLKSMFVRSSTARL